MIERESGFRPDESRARRRVEGQPATTDRLEPDVDRQLWMASSATAQTPVGALAIDERQGDQYGWAVDYETPGSAQAAASRECGAGCSVILTFERCAAYAADQDAGSTAVGWAESYSSSAAARQAALGECSSRGDGSGCIVRVWGCNGPVMEEGLGLDRAARRQVQEGLQAAGFDRGGADGMFGPRTRSAIWSWQTSRGTRATGYLDGASVAALRSSVTLFVVVVRLYADWTGVLHEYRYPAGGWTLSRLVLVAAGDGGRWDAGLAVPVG